MHGSEKVKFEEDANLTAETSQWLLNGGVPEHSVAVASKGTLKLGDAAGFLGYANVAECASAEEATVMPGDLSEVTHANSPVAKSRRTAAKALACRDRAWKRRTSRGRPCWEPPQEGTPRLSS